MTVERLQEILKVAKEYLSNSRKANGINPCFATEYDLGYWMGRVSVLEQWLDDLMDGGNSNV